MSFSGIKGQERPIAVLKKYIETASLRAGFLFAGPEGVGKKMAAKTLAKALNCENKSQDSCDSCSSCLKIEKDIHPDIFLLDASVPLEPESDQDSFQSKDSQAIKIGHIRKIKRDISLKPYEARVKVFIIDNAHNLTQEASNAFLKILEEPPGDSLLILVTDKPGLLLRTVASRCKIIRFAALQRQRLAEILKSEYGLDVNRAHFLAYFSEGRFGRALKLKDTDILREKNTAIDKFVFSRKFRLDNLSLEKKEDIRNYLNILSTWFRDLYLLKTGFSFQEVINFDRRQDLLEASRRCDFRELQEILKSLSGALFYLERNINTRLLLYELGVNLCRG
jgi:DNA polymerase-3 subunit delta'